MSSSKRAVGKFFIKTKILFYVRVQTSFYFTSIIAQCEEQIYFACAAVVFGGILFTAVYAGIWVPFKRRKRILESLRDIKALRESALSILENSTDKSKFDHALERSFKKYARHTLLMEGISPEDASQTSCIREATNYVIQDFVLGEITEANIRTMHAHIMKFEKPDIAGMFRQINVGVPAQRTSIFWKPKPFVAPPHAEVPKLMQDFIKWLNDEQPQTFESRLLLAAEAKLKLVTIHPFEDGNGRASRALLAGLLCKSRGFPFVTILTDTKPEYFSSLHSAEVTGNSEQFVEFCLRMIKESLESFVEDLSNPENFV